MGPEEEKSTPHSNLTIPVANSIKVGTHLDPSGKTANGQVCSSRRAPRGRTPTRTDKTAQRSSEREGPSRNVPLNNLTFEGQRETQKRTSRQLESPPGSNVLDAKWMTWRAGQNAPESEVSISLAHGSAFPHVLITKNASDRQRTCPWACCQAKSARLGNSRYGLPNLNADSDIDPAGAEALDTYPRGSICSSVWERKLPCRRRW